MTLLYYVNREQIERRIVALEDVCEALQQVSTHWDSSLTSGFVQERALHLAIECVTDIGSYLIDGFIMRDASSYDDIVDIMRDEKVIDQPMGEMLTALVRLRRPLVQEYYDWNRTELHPLSTPLVKVLKEFGQRIHTYLDQELDSLTVVNVDRASGTSTST